MLLQFSLLLRHLSICSILVFLCAQLHLYLYSENSNEFPCELCQHCLLSGINPQNIEIFRSIFTQPFILLVPATLAVYHYLDLLPHCLITFSPLNFVNIFLSSWLSHLQSHMVHVVHELNSLKLNFFLTDEKFLMLTCHVGYIRKS